MRRREAEVGETAQVVALLPPVDCVYATAVLGTTRMLATFYWAQSRGHNRPLILLEYSCEPLVAGTWNLIRERLDSLVTEQRSRAPCPLGIWVEGEVLAVQAMHAGMAARSIPPHLERVEAWHGMCQSAAAFLARREVSYARAARAAMEARPFLRAGGVEAGPRTDDPMLPAFLYGVVLGLDEVLSRDPHPRPPKRSRGQ